MNQLLVLLVWFLVCGVCNGYISSGILRGVIPRTRSVFALNGMTFDELEKNINIYLAFKNNTEISESDNPKDYKDIGLSPLDMFKPRGWYKDTYALDIKSRSDATIPKISHPLSYVELQRLGWGNLTIPIMELGGPIVVGEKLGLGWVDPGPEIVTWDESLRPVREVTYALDVSGNLQLGGSLEEKLAMAADLDMAMLKRKREESLLETDNNTKNNLNQRSQFYTDDDGEAEYNKAIGRVKRKTSNNVEPSTPRSEKFSLTGLQRLHMVVVGFAIALSHGRASNELVTSSEWGELASTMVSIATVASSILIVSAAGSVGLCARLSKEKGRNPMVWGVKGLLGGPLTVSQLQGLSSLGGQGLGPGLGEGERREQL